MLTIPTRYRTTVYAVYATLGLGVGSTQVAYAAAEAGQPVWLTVTLAVYAYVGGGIGYTAATHVPAAPDYVGEHRTDYATATRLQTTENDGAARP